ncbi:pseudouridine synthase, RluA family [Synechococcus sp. PCC 7335]|uniref:pseudouridine synthase n=1 Tax=Synechococcus sp. (strain ATCC 29403 / PCC 7335) TaxID=91464 RepID=UPI00017EB49E|nr:pseudouridine synthase [Synechococcus sp. PCC 7335]EDX85551.1 pseudouridine synthase, RluA family [Synechococcus sp. PCC 7335]
MLNQGWTYLDKVPAAAVGQTVLDFYTQRYRHSKRAVWKARIETEQILLDGDRTQENTLLKLGQILSYARSPWEEPAVPLDFDVLYEDEDLWVINKPAGLPVLPSGGFLEHTLLYQLRVRYRDCQSAPVHRLGRGTSGAMLIAKSHIAKVQLSEQFRKRSANLSSNTTPNTASTCTLGKTYRALIAPTTPDQLRDRFICTYPIGKLPHTRLGYIYGHLRDAHSHEKTIGPINSMVSRSEGSVLRRRAHSTLVEITIQTGRPHQIRIHLAAAGYPLLGDPLYSAGGVPDPHGYALPGDCGYHLHAHRLQFAHPRTGQSIAITAPPPAILS